LVNTQREVETSFIQERSSLLVRAGCIDSELLGGVWRGTWIFTPIDTDYADAVGRGEWKKTLKYT
jgi:hypothetical protein